MRRVSVKATEKIFLEKTINIFEKLHYIQNRKVSAYYIHMPLYQNDIKWVLEQFLHEDKKYEIMEEI